MFARELLEGNGEEEGETDDGEGLRGEAVDVKTAQEPPGCARCGRGGRREVGGGVAG